MSALKVKAQVAKDPSVPFSACRESFRPASGASEAASGRSSGGYCRGGQTGKVFTLNHSHLKKEGRLPKSASHSFSAAPREVCLERCNVVVVAGVLRAAGTGQLELLGSVGQLECSVRVGCVGQQCALPFQHVSHSFEQVQETKGQGSLA